MCDKSPFSLMSAMTTEPQEMISIRFEVTEVAGDEEEESDSPTGDNGGYIAFYKCQRRKWGVNIFNNRTREKM